MCIDLRRSYLHLTTASIVTSDVPFSIYSIYINQRAYFFNICHAIPPRTIQSWVYLWYGIHWMNRVSYHAVLKLLETDIGLLISLVSVWGSRSHLIRWHLIRQCNHMVLLNLKLCPAMLNCVLLASPLDATAPYEVVISPVRVNLEACVLSWWLPADYSPVLCSSWRSPAEHDAGEKWTTSCPPFVPHAAQVHPSSCWRGKETSRIIDGFSNETF